MNRSLLSSIHAELARFDKSEELRKTTTTCTDADLNVYEEELVDGQYIQKPQGNKLNTLTKLEKSYYLGKEICKVVSGLYIGSMHAASHKDVLLEFGITHIVCVAPRIGNKFPDDFQYLCFDIVDEPTAPLLSILNEATAFIDDSIVAKGGCVFVHCHRGVSRSASVVIAYLMKSRRIPYSEALQLAVEARPKVYPNEGFRRQLQEYEAQLGIQTQPAELETLQEEDEEEEGE